MLLADTSVWIDHLHGRDTRLRGELLSLWEALDFIGRHRLSKAAAKLGVFAGA
jgi:hypothetical protein